MRATHFQRGRRTDGRRFRGTVTAAFARRSAAPHAASAISIPDAADVLFARSLATRHGGAALSFSGGPHAIPHADPRRYGVDEQTNYGLVHDGMSNGDVSFREGRGKRSRSNGDAQTDVAVTHVTSSVLIGQVAPAGSYVAAIGRQLRARGRRPHPDSRRPPNE
jgi:hypothetical protein